MFEGMILIDILTTVASFITSLTIVGGAFYKWGWVPYEKKKLTREQKKEAKEEKYRQQMIEITESKVSPLSEEIKLLLEVTNKHEEMDVELKGIAKQNIEIIQEIRKEFKDHNRQSAQRDRLIEQNSNILKKHDDRLDNHSDRILILETVTGVPRIKNRNKEEE